MHVDVCMYIHVCIHVNLWVYSMYNTLGCTCIGCSCLCNVYMYVCYDMAEAHAAVLN